MDEIIIEKSQKDFEKERAQLIENIIVSEIDYARNKELGNLEYVQEDERVIADWMDRFSITKEDILAERQRVLLSKKSAITGYIEVASPVAVEVAEPVVEEKTKDEIDVETIDSLLTKDISFKFK